MAAGSSAPELATAVIAVFIAKVSVTFKIDQNKIVIQERFCNEFDCVVCGIIVLHIYMLK